MVKWGVIGACGIAKRRTIPEGIMPAKNAELVAVMDIALLATVSSLEKILPQIEKIVRYGINVVSTCAIIINAIRSIIDVTPGLKTMVDIPILSFLKEAKTN